MNSTKPHADLFTSQLRNVEQLISQNRLQEAADRLNNLGKSAPNDPRLFLLASLMAQAANNSGGMLAAAIKAVDFSPGWSVASIRLAEVQLTLNDVSLALQTAERAVKEATSEGTLNAEFLSKATTIAIRCQQFSKAINWAEQASKFAPGNANLKHRLGEAKAYCGEFQQAIDIYSDLLKSDSHNEALLLDRLLAFLNIKNKEMAQIDSSHLLSLDPLNTTYQYYDALIKGETPNSLPEQVVRSLFDSSAANFDKHLVTTLNYTLPHYVAQKILAWYPDKKLDLLDLGCGTGLLGAYLGRMNGVIVGVDLSSEMINKAHQHHVYAQFNQVNILDALKETQANYYDVITALDVLIYVGDLEPVIPNAHRILTSGGRFIFSCESASKEVKSFSLQDTQRYVHNEDYVHKLLISVGFKDIQFEEQSIRLEAGQPVQGFVVTVRK